MAFSLSGMNKRTPLRIALFSCISLVALVVVGRLAYINADLSGGVGYGGTLTYAPQRIYYFGRLYVGVILLITILLALKNKNRNYRIDSIRIRFLLCLVAVICLLPVSAAVFTRKTLPLSKEELLHQDLQSKVEILNSGSEADAKAKALMSETIEALKITPDPSYPRYGEHSLKRGSIEYRCISGLVNSNSSMNRDKSIQALRDYLDGEYERGVSSVNIEIKGLHAGVEFDGAILDKDTDPPIRVSINLDVCYDDPSYVPPTYDY